jgi:hypothetical protein
VLTSVALFVPLYTGGLDTEYSGLRNAKKKILSPPPPAPRMPAQPCPTPEDFGLLPAQESARPGPAGPRPGGGQLSALEPPAPAQFPAGVPRGWGSGGGLDGSPLEEAGAGQRPRPDCQGQRRVCFGRPGGQCRSAPGNKALLGAGPRPAGEPGPAGTGREVGRGGGAGRASGGAWHAAPR